MALRKTVPSLSAPARRCRKVLRPEGVELLSVRLPPKLQLASGPHRGHGGPLARAQALQLGQPAPQHHRFAFAPVPRQRTQPARQHRRRAARSRGKRGRDIRGCLGAAPDVGRQRLEGQPRLGGIGRPQHHERVAAAADLGEGGAVIHLIDPALFT